MGDHYVYVLNKQNRMCLIWDSQIMNALIKDRRRTGMIKVDKNANHKINYEIKKIY